MRLFNRLRSLVVLSRRRHFEDNMADEIGFHLEAYVEELMRSGVPRAEAVRRARIEFGGVEAVKEECRRSRGLHYLDALRQDLRYALRTMRRDWGFTAVVVLSLALGIGANTALFSVIDAALLRKLPVEKPDQLVFFEWEARGWRPENVVGGISRNRVTEYTSSNSFSPFVFDRLRRESKTLSDVFAYVPTFEASVRIDEQSDRASAQLVSGNYFAALKVPAAAGRTITDDDDRKSAQPVALISHRFWQNQFSMDPTVVGKKVFLNGVALTIIGVTPPEFRGTGGFGSDAPGFFVPLALAPRLRQIAANGETNIWWLLIMGRMRPGMNEELVRADLEGPFQGAAMESSSSIPALVSLNLLVEPGSRGFGRGGSDLLEVLILLSGVFGFLLLIVCLNVANLQLARAAAREGEIGVRLAMGASRLRLIRQLLTESVVLALTGGALGAVLAYWGKDVFASLSLRQDLILRIDPRVLAFTGAVSFVTAFTFGLAPAFKGTRKDVQSAVKRNTETAGGGRSRLNKLLLVTQVAMSAVLLIGAGLFVQTLGNWRSVDPGFNTKDLLVFGIDPISLQYDESRSASLYEEVLMRIQTIPGVIEVTRSDAFWSYWVPGMRIKDGPEWLPIEAHAVRQNFLETLGIQLLAGRNLTAADGRSAPKVAVIDERAARRYFPGTNPIGRRFGFMSKDPRNDIEIVGVVRDITIPRSESMQTTPRVFVPELQQPVGMGAGARSYLVRTAGDPLALVPAIRQAVWEMDPNLPVLDVKTMEQGIQRRLEPVRYLSFTWSLFGGFAVLLTCIGLYGLMSYSVVRRTHEIGVRMALGAGRFQVLRLVMGQSVSLVVLGLAIGLAASLAINQMIRALIFGVTLYDPLTLVVVSAALLAVTGAAGYLPARRASRMDPTVALRQD